MSSSLSKIPETGMNVFKSNSQIIKIKNIIKYQPYASASKEIDEYTVVGDYINKLKSNFNFDFYQAVKQH